MMERRLWANPTCPFGCCQIAWPSGPRWAWRAFMTSSLRARAGIGRRERSRAPAIPHTVLGSLPDSTRHRAEGRQQRVQRPLQGSRMPASEPDEHREVLEALKADPYIRGRVLEMNQTAERAVVPLDGPQLAPVHRAL